MIHIMDGFFPKMWSLFLILQMTSGNQEGMIFTVDSIVFRSDIFTHLRIFNTTPYDTSSQLHSTRIWLTNFPTVGFYGCDVNYRQKQLYVSEGTTAAIYVYENIDPNDFDNLTINLFHPGVTPAVHVKISVDWISNNVYWVDPYHNWIAVQPGTNQNTDPTLYKIIVEEDLVLPTGLAIDPIAGYLFWCNAGNASRRIERSDLFGADRRVIVSRGLGAPVSIAIDHAYSNIYWVDAVRDTVERVDYNGADRKTLRRMSHTLFYDIALYLDSVIITERRENRILFLNKVTGEIIRSYTADNERFYGVAMFSDRNQPITAANRCLSMNCDDICIGGGTASTACACRLGWQLNPDGRTCTEKFGYFYRGVVTANDTSICILDKDSVTSSTFSYRCLTNLNHSDSDDTILFIDVDSNSREFIYATRDKINIIGLNGDNHDTLVATASPVSGLSLDWINRNIYFIETNGMSYVLSLQTKNWNILLTFDQTRPRDIVVDPYVGRLYWISEETGTTIIESANLDGTQRTTLVTSGELDNPKSLVVDYTNQQLYWVDEGYIRRCSVDGTNLERINISTTNIFVNPNRLLVYKNYLVWTEDVASDISRINVNSKITPFTKINEYAFIQKVVNINALDPIIQQQEKGPCELFNGGCEHICLPTANNNRECQCELGFELDSNGETCLSSPFSDHFLLMTDWTHNKIYQVSSETGEVQGVRTGRTGSPTGVAFDPIRGHVIWGESDDAIIRLMRLDGPMGRFLSETGFMFGAYPDRFAIDMSSGNVFYTAVKLTTQSGFAGVAVLTLDGKHKKLVEDGNAPRAIVLEPEEGLMFWTDHAEGNIWRANMDGTNRFVLLGSSELTLPNGIAIDYTEKMLYVTDGSTNEIHRCTYTGSCLKVYEDTEAWLMSIYLSGGYLYYTSWNNPYITKIDKATFTDKTRLANNPELGRLDDVLVYNTSEPSPPVHRICSDNNGLGPCSTFCLPRGRDAFVCACEDGVNLSTDFQRCENVPLTTTSTTTATTIRTSTGTTAVPTTTTTTTPTTTTTTTRTTVTTTKPTTTSTTTPTTAHTSSSSTTTTSSSSSSTATSTTSIPTTSSSSIPTTSSSIIPTTSTTSIPTTSSSITTTTTSIPTTTTTSITTVVADLEDDPGIGLPIIAGFAAGGLIILVLIIVVIIVVCRRKQAPKQPPCETQGPPDTTRDDMDNSVYDEIGDLIDLRHSTDVKTQTPLVGRQQNQYTMAITNPAFAGYEPLRNFSRDTEPQRSNDSVPGRQLGMGQQAILHHGIPTIDGTLIPTRPQPWSMSNVSGGDRSTGQYAHYISSGEPGEPDEGEYLEPVTSGSSSYISIKGREPPTVQFHRSDHVNPVYDVTNNSA